MNDIIIKMRDLFTTLLSFNKKLKGKKRLTYQGTKNIIVLYENKYIIRKNR